MPEHHTIKSNKYLKIFGDSLHDANLWHLNRRSVRKAFAIGLFFAFIPVPFQMILAASCAIFFRGNIPLSVGLVWLSNPITIPPIFYACYKLGTILMNVPVQEFTIEISWQWLLASLGTVGGPFLVGSVFCATLFSIIGYYGINAVWRLSIVRHWHKRKQR